MKLGNVGCGVTTGTASEITCTLSSGPAAGTYAAVEVISVDGRVPVDPAVTPITVALQITTISPTSDLNQSGGDTVTITGSSLPWDVNDLQVNFSDGTNCQVVESSDTQATCITDAFDPNTIDTATPYTVNIAVNSETDSTNTVMLANVRPGVVSITPDSVSPVLKQDLTI